MRVSVDIKTLLYKVEQYNPGCDLDGLKAYLFDLMLQPSGAVEEAVAPVSRVVPPPTTAIELSPPPPRVDVPVAAPTRAPQPAPRPMGQPSTGGPNPGAPNIDNRGVYLSTPAKLSAGAAAKKAEREKRRSLSTAGAFQNMTSKQILQGLYNEEAKRDDHGQFTGEGRDPRPGDDDHSGDIEI